MNFLLFGLFLIELCSASSCLRYIRILSVQKKELRIERNKLKEENKELKRKLEALQTTTTTTRVQNIGENLRERARARISKFSGERAPKFCTLTTTPIAPSDVFILVISGYLETSFLQSGNGSSQISATINAPENYESTQISALIKAPKNYYAKNAAPALVNGELHVFGGWANSYKIARLDGCTFNELPARLNEERIFGHAALSVENGRKALVCFGSSDDTVKSCEIFDGSSTAPTFAAKWTHYSGGLGLFKNQPATVGCWSAHHQKAETLSATGWTALPAHPLQISEHSLVGLQNGAMLLLGGVDEGSDSKQTGIWELKEDQWSRIGELSKPATSGSAIYVSRSVYYFEWWKNAIYRVDLDENEELEAVEEIGSQPGIYDTPVLFQTDNDTCT